MIAKGKVNSMNQSSVIPFNIPNGSSCHCVISKYSKSHTHLEIEIAYLESTKHLIFEGVEYFSGPMMWKGADLAVATPSECLRLLHQLGRYDEFPDEYLLDKFRLFLIAPPPSTTPYVFILARTAALSD